MPRPRRRHEEDPRGPSPGPGRGAEPPPGRGSSVGLPYTTRDRLHVARAQRAGVGWPLPEDMDDDGPGGPAVPVGHGRRSPAPARARLARGPPRAAPQPARDPAACSGSSARSDHPDGCRYTPVLRALPSARSAHQDVVMRLAAQSRREDASSTSAATRLPVVDPETGRGQTRPQLFVAVLGGSGMTCTSTCSTSAGEPSTGSSAHVHAFEDLWRLAPSLSAPDNLKSGVTQAVLLRARLNHRTYARAGRPLPAAPYCPLAVPHAP